MAHKACGHFILVYDISHAHRQVAVDEDEWGRLACQIEGTAADTLQEQLPILRDKRETTAGPTSVSFRGGQRKVLVGEGRGLAGPPLPLLRTTTTTTTLATTLR